MIAKPPAADGADQRTAASPCARPVRVCHVSMHLKTGGLERLLVEFAKRHDRDRFAPVFVALQDAGPPATEIENLGWPVHALNIAGLGKRRALQQLRSLMVKHDVQVVHTHNTYAHYYGSRAAAFARCPVLVNTQHGRGCGAGWKARAQFVLANLRADAVIGVSQDATRLCAAQDWWSRGRMRTIWNGIDTSRFEYAGPKSAPVAVAVGRLSPEKDFANLLRGTALAVRDVPDLRVRIIGDGRERAALEQLSHSLNLQGRVEFLGERSDVHALLRDVGFYVSSSRTEGISLTLLEAMAVGLPVLATRVGGNAEVIEEGVSGRLVPAENPEALAAGLVAMCRDQSEWTAMGQIGRARVERDFDVTRMVREYEALYAEFIPSGEPGGVSPRFI
ncbi:MAG: GT4 family glycosyltransferase PelF [Planctomycetaceae bacterium]|nr:GT4 family glycosyltransferase PelF [Planctomycetaceae bacterium]